LQVTGAGTSDEGTMRKVVLTGGPCSGKSSVQRALHAEFGPDLVLVPEAATLLLEGGFPVPGTHLPWSPHWQAAFQAAVLPLQRSLEDAWSLVAQSQGSRLIVCDRGLLDGAAYTPGGVEEFCRRFGVDAAQALARYEAVVHLESLATADPQRYGTSGNAIRFEPLEVAVRLEMATRAAWAGHPRHFFLDGGRGLDGKIAAVRAFLRDLLSASGGRQPPVSATGG
jgi:predicted ATPase